MPELPEVQTIVNDLQILTGDRFTGFWTNFEKAIKSKKLKKELVGQKIKSIKRMGKNIVFELDNEKFLILHLKMTGKLILSEKKSNTNTMSLVTGHLSLSKHLHHVFNLNKNGALEFHDIRKFATLEIVSKERLSAMIKEKGVDPLSTSFTFKKFQKLLASKENRNIKSFLMDQTAISGIGNIYASEIPFNAKLDPHRKMISLSKSEALGLHRSILKILKKAILLRGTSFSDYRDAKNLRGSFQNHLKVYKKAGKKCVKCGTIIEKSVVEQRSTFYCPTCQK
ncbi:MAG: hypothetical protein ACD_5C00257G0002 [uncultured bacterium]|nr:MAG: hypothetical protein ACD_5C00257G0002 [uncultured bacterium]